MLVAALTALLPLQATEPLAPAWEGMVQCHTPVPEERTCRAIARFERSGDGAILNYAEIVLSPAEPLLIARIKELTIVRGSLVCSITKLDPSNIESVAMDGETFTAVHDPFELRPWVADMLSEAWGDGEMCVRYEPAANGAFTPIYSLDGKPLPDDGDTIIWVHPEDGWRVAP